MGVFFTTEKRKIYKTSNNSLACNVPSFYRHIFGFKAGDELDWSLENVDGEYCLVVRGKDISEKFKDMIIGQNVPRHIENIKKIFSGQVKDQIENELDDLEDIAGAINCLQSKEVILLTKKHLQEATDESLKEIVLSDLACFKEIFTREIESKEAIPKEREKGKEKEKSPVDLSKKRYHEYAEEVFPPRIEAPKKKKMLEELIKGEKVDLGKIVESVEKSLSLKKVLKEYSVTEEELKKACKLYKGISLYHAAAILDYIIENQIPQFEGCDIRRELNMNLGGGWNWAIAILEDRVLVKPEGYGYKVSKDIVKRGNEDEIEAYREDINKYEERMKEEKYCPFCGSRDLTKRLVEIECNVCHERTRYDPQVVLLVFDLYKKDLTPKEIKALLTRLNISVPTIPTIEHWIGKKREHKEEKSNKKDTLKKIDEDLDKYCSLKNLIEKFQISEDELRNHLGHLYYAGKIMDYVREHGIIEFYAGDVRKALDIDTGGQWGHAVHYLKERGYLKAEALSHYKVVGTKTERSVDEILDEFKKIIKKESLQKEVLQHDPRLIGLVKELDAIGVSTHAISHYILRDFKIDVGPVTIAEWLKKDQLATKEKKPSIEGAIKGIYERKEEIAKEKELEKKKNSIKKKIKEIIHSYGFSDGANLENILDNTNYSEGEVRCILDELIEEREVFHPYNNPEIFMLIDDRAKVAAEA